MVHRRKHSLHEIYVTADRKLCFYLFRFSYARAMATQKLNAFNRRLLDCTEAIRHLQKQSSLMTLIALQDREKISLFCHVLGS